MFPANPHAARDAIRELFGRVFVSQLPYCYGDPREQGRKAAKKASEILRGAEIGIDQTLAQWLDEWLAEMPDDCLATAAEKPVQLFGAPLELPQRERSLVLQRERRQRLGPAAGTDSPQNPSSADT